MVQSQVKGLERAARALGVELAEGPRIEAALVVAADGADSPTRRLMGIETRHHTHEQQAVVSHIRTGQPHRSTAWQRFLETGPIALLPLHDGRSSIVWTTTGEAAATLVALSFALGRWTGDAFEADYTVELTPTASAPGASAVVDVGARDPDSGNVELVLNVSGLPKLGPDETYALWLEQDGEWAATCGYFAVGEGETTVRMTVSYDFRDFDAWVISDGNRREEPPPLLEARIPAA